MAIKPISDKILVEVIDEDAQKVGSLYVPDTARERPQMGKIIAVGDGRRDGKDIIPMSVKEGQTVLFGKYAGTEIKHEGSEYLLLSENDVLAIIE